MMFYYGGLTLSEKEEIRDNMLIIISLITVICMLASFIMGTISTPDTELDSLLSFGLYVVAITYMSFGAVFEGAIVIFVIMPSAEKKITNKLIRFFIRFLLTAVQVLIICAECFIISKYFLERGILFNTIFMICTVELRIFYLVVSNQIWNSTLKNACISTEKTGLRKRLKKIFSC